MDEDGSWLMSGRFTPEVGELIMRAIDAAVDEIEAEQQDVSAETCIPDWDGQRMDDDLVVEALFPLE